MPDLLTCSYSKCQSHTSPDHPPRFTVRLEVTSDGKVISDVHDIEDDCFFCVHCGDEATSKREN